MAAKLNAGDQFPSLTLLHGESGTLQLPQALDGAYNIVLFYRGHW